MPQATVVSLLPTVLPVTEGSSGTLTVTLNAAQPTDTDVALGASDATVVGLPPGEKVTVPAHTLSTAVPIQGHALGLATEHKSQRVFRTDLGQSPPGLGTGPGETR